MACNCNKVSNTEKTKRVTKILNLDRLNQMVTGDEEDNGTPVEEGTGQTGNQEFPGDGGDDNGTPVDEGSGQTGNQGL